MGRNFWKATLVSVAAYAAALLIGFWGDFRFTLFAVPALQVTWTLFCVIQVVRLRLRGGHKLDAAADEREEYGFALGGALSSITFLAAIVVLTQVV
jgi:hypothetical protein